MTRGKMNGRKRKRAERVEKGPITARKEVKIRSNKKKCSFCFYPSRT